MSFLLRRAAEDFTGPAPESVLKITEVDLCFSENGKEHRTSSYDTMQRDDDETHLVIRRGQSFKLSLKLSRDYDPIIDSIAFVFELQHEHEKDPKVSNSIRAFARALQPGQVSERAWQAEIGDDNSDKSLRIVVTPGANIPVGKWLMNIDTKRLDSLGSRRFTEPRLLYLLFNPWCKDDLVYLENESERLEYVLNDTGFIWKVQSDKVKPDGWSFSQFTDSSLDCALYILTSSTSSTESTDTDADADTNTNTNTNTDSHTLTAIKCKDPAMVTRQTAFIVNEMLAGNWSVEPDGFQGGTKPWDWPGSLEILKKYYSTKKPVKYAQCWVYAGVLASICRSLGLPCRVVTNFKSGHEENNSTTIDNFVDENGKDVEESEGYFDESIWSFHVWNEVWMKRLDLGSDYHGWQVLDGTYGIGPASVVAIKRGEVEQPYDATFIYAEVNADLVWWEYNTSSKNFKIIKKDINRIGQFISTKAVRNDKVEREDITLNYKYKESSKEERASVKKALLQREIESEIASWYLSESEQKNFDDLEFQVEPKNGVMIGKPFSVVLTVQNRNDQKTYEIAVLLRVNATIYTGRKIGEVKESKQKKVVMPNTAVEVKLDISWEDYGNKLLNSGSLQVVCFAPVKDVGFTFITQEKVTLLKPDIIIKLENEKENLVVKKQTTATARFTNPLPVPLKKGNFIIDFKKYTITVHLTDDVKVGGEAIGSFLIVPESAGPLTVIVKFSSDELNDINGFRKLIVQAESSATTNSA